MLAYALLGEARHVAISGADVLVVLNDHEVAVAAHPALELDHAVAGGVDRRAAGRRVVHALVRAHATQDRMHAAGAEARGDAGEVHRNAQERLLDRAAVLAEPAVAAVGLLAAEPGKAIALLLEHCGDEKALFE